MKSGDRWTGLVGSQSIVCRLDVVWEDFSKFDRLGFRQMGSSGQKRVSLVLFPRTGVKGERGDGGLTVTRRDTTGVYHTVRKKRTLDTHLHYQL